MLFHLLPKFPNITRAVINDINPKLISVYKMIRDNPLQLIECLENIDADFTALKDQEDKKGYYLKARQQFNIGEMGECEESALLIFLNRTCFNGLYRVNSKGFLTCLLGSMLIPKFATVTSSWQIASCCKKSKSIAVILPS